MRILLVTNMYPQKQRPNWGTFVQSQALQLERLGHQVEVLVIQGYQSKLAYLKTAFRVLAKTFREPYDLVHAHYGLSGLSALLRWRTPLVVTLHGSDVLVGKLQPWVSRWVARLAHATIVVSRQLQSEVPGVVIPCGVDLELFQPRDRLKARALLGLAPEKRLVLFPFDPTRAVKRVDLAEAAVEELRRRGRPADLLTVFNQEHERMPLYYSAADVMILCSTTEGSPTSVKEALACNTPVVSTDVGDVREILTASGHGRICQASPDKLADGLEEMLSSRSGSRKTSRSSMKEYDETLLVKRLLEIYEAVTGQQRRGLKPSVDVVQS